MESLSFKDIKVGGNYQISVTIGIENFYFAGVKTYYINVKSINKVGERYLITGDYFIQHIDGDISYYCNGDEFFTEIKEISIREVVYDVFKEQKTKEELKRAIAENTATMFEAMDRRFDEIKFKYNGILIAYSIVLAATIFYILVS